MTTERPRIEDLVPALEPAAAQARRRTGTAIAAGAAGVALDALAAYLIWMAGGNALMFALGLIVHLAAAGLAGGLLWYLWRPEGAGWAASAGTLTAISIPPLGAVLIAGVVIWHTLQGPHVLFVPPVTEDPEPAPLKLLPATGRIVVSDLLKADTEVQPLADILHGGDLQLKASAIDVMTRLQGKQLIRMMRDLLRAPESDIRFQASVGLSKLEASMSDTIAQAKIAAEGDRTDPENARLLGRLYLDYALSGLLDETTAAHYATMALIELRRAETLDPAVRTTVDQARCHMVLKDLAECLELLNNQTVASEDQEQAVMLRLEARYALGEYDKLREEAAAVIDVVFEDPANEAIVQWWATA